MNEEQLTVYAQPITSLYYIKAKIPEDVLEKINEDIDCILKDKTNFEKWNENLAGNIEEEYEFSTKSSYLIEDFSLDVAKSYFQVTEDENLNPTKRLDHAPNFFEKEVKYTLKNLWINFQKKYEFNPIHSHTGDYSFVIWMHIPYDLSEELNYKNSKNSVQPSNSLFEFHFNYASGILQSLPLYIDKSWEGTMIMFPSWLYHSVNPFYTSDDYRISISGNIEIEEDFKDD